MKEVNYTSNRITIITHPKISIYCRSKRAFGFSCYFLFATIMQLNFTAFHLGFSILSCDVFSYFVQTSEILTSEDERRMQGYPTVTTSDVSSVLTLPQYVSATLYQLCKFSIIRVLQRGRGEPSSLLFLCLGHRFVLFIYYLSSDTKNRRTYYDLLYPI